MFKKSQNVNLVKSWDDKGTVSITPAIVYSCGKKQMVLTHAVTGEELGRNFKPMREGWAGELVLTIEENAETVAMEMAIVIREKFIANETKMIANGNGSEYWAKRQVALDKVIAGSASVIKK